MCSYGVQGSENGVGSEQGSAGVFGTGPDTVSLLLLFLCSKQALDVDK
jgi:hypothetical protein